MTVSRNMKITAGVTAVLLAGATGVAYALWSSTATGSGRARATTAVDATVSPADGTADLYPGFTGGDLYFTITNTNPYPITYTAGTAGTITSSDPTNCPASNVTVAPLTGLTLVAPANGTSGQLSIPDVVTMASNAPDGCQGVSFDVALTLTGAQS